MKAYHLVLIIGFVIYSCGGIEKEQLIGNWKNNTWEFNFREDNTCMMANNGVVQGEKLKYRTFGNTIEISRDGKVVLGGVTVKSLDASNLTLEFRNLVGSGNKMNQLQVLTKQ